MYVAKERCMVMMYQIIFSGLGVRFYGLLAGKPLVFSLYCSTVCGSPILLADFLPKQLSTHAESYVSAVIDGHHDSFF